MSPSQYAKQIGWRSLKECQEFLGLGKNSMPKLFLNNPVKFRALVRGGWLEYNEKST